LPSPLLKDAWISIPTEPYEMVIDFMQKLYNARLVHADLNEFNIVYHNRLPYFIDWGQGVKLEHPKAIEFLSKDVTNDVKFFTKQGVDCNFEDAFKKITNQ
jgi:RIO kinase 1